MADASIQRRWATEEARRHRQYYRDRNEKATKVASFNILLETDGASEQTVKEWIAIWLDSSGGRWGNPERSGDAWGVTVEDFNYDAEQLRRELENTQKNLDPLGQLKKFEIVPV